MSPKVWLAVAGCSFLALAGELFVGCGFAFNPGWANGWPFGLTIHSVWSAGMSFLLFPNPDDCGGGHWRDCWCDLFLLRRRLSSWASGLCRLAGVLLCPGIGCQPLGLPRNLRFDLGDVAQRISFTYGVEELSEPPSNAALRSRRGSPWRQRESPWLAHRRLRTSTPAARDVPEPNGCSTSSSFLQNLLCHQDSSVGRE